MLKDLRAALESALRGARGSGDGGEATRLMREAVIEATVAIKKMRDGLARTGRELTGERRKLEDAERRGRLAEGIGDRETVEIANRFARKHLERVAVLERKASAQRDELALAERELDEMRAQLAEAARDLRGTAAGRRADEAWRTLGQAGARRTSDPADEFLRADLDRTAREAAAEAQLEELKKRMGR